jgi:hypothetical protein
MFRTKPDQGVLPHPPNPAPHDRRYGFVIDRHTLSLTARLSLNVRCSVLASAGPGYWRGYPMRHARAKDEPGASRWSAGRGCRDRRTGWIRPSQPDGQRHGFPIRDDSS